MSPPDDAYPVPVESLAAHHDKFLQFLSGRVADRAAGEDILQSAYVKAIQSADNLRSSESIVAWFYRILRNSVIDFYRRNAARSAALEGLAAELPASYETELRNQACACVTELIQELKPEYRDAVQHIDLAEEPVSTYAATKGITVNNATVRLHRGRKALAGRLAQTCGVCAEHKCIDCTCRRT